MSIKLDQIEIEDESKQFLDEEKEEWLGVLEDKNETAAIQKLRQLTHKEILDNERLNKIKNLCSSSASATYIEEYQKKVKSKVDLNGQVRKGEDFNLDDYRNENKTDLAYEMANHAVYNNDIRPVDSGEHLDETQLFAYNDEKKIWRPFSDNRIGKLGYRMAQKEFTIHLKREFKNFLKNHEETWHRNSMGLRKNELMVRGGKILSLGSIVKEDIGNLNVRDAKKKDKVMHVVDVEYDPDAETPTKFLNFVDDLLAGNERQIRTLQEWLGYLLKFPHGEHQKALLILGVSNSGKSQLAMMLEKMFSDHSYSNLSFPQIGMERRYHLDRLQGKILNIEKDLSFQNIEDTSNIKQVISQEPIYAEPKGQDGFEINPKAKHLVCANVAPQLKHALDDAFYERFLTLKAPNPVPKEDRINNLGSKLIEEEGSGILLWMLRGLKRLERNEEFSLEPSAEENRRIWQEYGNSVSRFVYEKCKITGNEEDHVATTNLYEWYEDWCEDRSNVKKYSMKEFVQKVKKNPTVWKKRKMIEGGRRRCFCGIRTNLGLNS